jgi:hypothetical protein
MSETVTVTETPNQDQYAADLEQANNDLRRAVAERHARQAVAPPPVAEAACDVTAEDCCQGARFPTLTKVDQAPRPGSGETPAEQLLEQARQTVRQRRGTYGPPTDHFEKTVGMINAAFAGVLNRPLTPSDWAIIMTLDKIARHQGPAKTADTPIDVAGYAACLAECEHAKPAIG